MPIHAVDDGTPGAYVLHVSGNRFVAVLHSSLDGFPADMIAAAADMQSRLQTFLDAFVEVDSLPADDPDRTNAPRRQDIETDVKQWIDVNSYYIKTGTPARVYHVHSPVQVASCVWVERKQNFVVSYRRRR